ncbi:iron complex transport system ATP-binding protein [Methylohalomonas lacus]|uniref:Iron complex transport system ATP-binding protein n=1 Tax=Methylohalomonas lacus TaxID=398773 RepID=A0AAE3HN87_9GAMM|nr:ABC transporter ATP-binding protein [Methylohalomonas lacus]MCS3903692.1 iron complex transport system ATP-binding protein [Methylohalomonas lacus]
MTLLASSKLDIRVAGRPLCRGLDFRMQPGECWALLGANGVGKTMLLHTLAGLRPADAGHVRINDRPLADWSARELARYRGVLFQDSQDTFPASVLETVLSGRHPYLRFWEFESAHDHELARQALARVGLQGLEARRVDTLSGGERRRLALATLLVQSPRVMLLDEPSNHLDLRHQMRLFAYLCELTREGLGGLLMSLHDVNLAQRFCSHVILMFGSGDVCTGPVAETLSEHTVSRLYDYPVHAVYDGVHCWYQPD